MHHSSDVSQVCQHTWPGYCMKRQGTFVQSLLLVQSAAKAKAQERCRSKMELGAELSGMPSG